MLHRLGAHLRFAARSRASTLPRATRRLRGRSRGLTLIEVVIAAALLAAVIVGVLIALTSALRASRELAAIELARVVVAERVEQVAILEPNEIATLRYVEGGASFDAAPFLPPPGVERVGLLEVLTEAEATVALGHAVDLDEDGIFSEAEAPHAGYRAACVRATLRFTVNGQDSFQALAVSFVVPREQEDP